MFRTALITLTALALGLCLALAASARPAGERREAAPAPISVYGLLQDNRIVTFNADTPGTTSTPLAITGVTGGLVAIDVRPSTGQLYGAARDSGGVYSLYRLNPVTGAASFVAQIARGDGFAMDIDPRADALRVTNDRPTNVLLSLDTGEQVRAPSTLTFQPGVEDGVVPKLGDLAYTDAAPDGTTLYATERSANQGVVSLVRIDDPATGVVERLRSINPSAQSTLGLALDIGPGTDTALGIRPGGGPSTLLRIPLAKAGVNTVVGRIGASDASRDQVFALAIAVPQPTISFVSARASVREDGAAATLTLLRDGPLTREVGVTVSTADGTATAPGDYTAVTQTLTFAPGQSVAELTVPIVDDSTYEAGAKTFTATLAAPTGGAALGAPAGTTVSILEDETPSTQTVTTTAPAPPPVTVTTTTPTPATTLTVPGPTTTVTVAATTPPPAADTSAPRLSLTVPGHVTPTRLRSTKRLRVGVSCSEACTFVATITGSGNPKGTLGTFRGTRTASGRVEVTVRLKAAALRGTLQGALTTRLVATDEAGNEATATRRTKIGPAS